MSSIHSTSSRKLSKRQQCNDLKSVAREREPQHDQRSERVVANWRNIGARTCFTGTRDGWVETKGTRENVRCRYERQEEVEWEKFHVKLFVRFGNNIWLFHACVDLQPLLLLLSDYFSFFTRTAVIECSWCVEASSYSR